MLTQIQLLDFLGIFLQSTVSGREDTADHDRMLKENGTFCEFDDKKMSIEFEPHSRCSHREILISTASKQYLATIILQLTKFSQP